MINIIYSIEITAINLISYAVFRRVTFAMLKV